MTTPTQLRPDPSTVPATMTPYQLMMADALAPLSVKCDRCGEPAGIGYDCRSKSGYTVPFHAARKAAVAHLTTDERIAAFAALRAAHERFHAEARARQAVREADPVYVAQRDATRAYISGLFDKAYEESAARERDYRARCADEPFRNSRTHADGCTCRTSGTVEYTPEFARAVQERKRRESLVGALPVTDLSRVRAGRRAPSGGAA